MRTSASALPASPCATIHQTPTSSEGTPFNRTLSSALYGAHITVTLQWSQRCSTDLRITLLPTPHLSSNPTSRRMAAYCFGRDGPDFGSTMSNSYGTLCKTRGWLVRPTSLRPFHRSWCLTVPLPCVASIAGLTSMIPVFPVLYFFPFSL